MKTLFPQATGVVQSQQTLNTADGCRYVRTENEIRAAIDSFAGGASFREIRIIGTIRLKDTIVIPPSASGLIISSPRATISPFATFGPVFSVQAVDVLITGINAISIDASKYFTGFIDIPADARASFMRVTDCVYEGEAFILTVDNSCAEAYVAGNRVSPITAASNGIEISSLFWHVHSNSISGFVVDILTNAPLGGRAYIAGNRVSTINTSAGGGLNAIIGNIGAPVITNAADDRVGLNTV